MQVRSITTQKKTEITSIKSLWAESCITEQFRIYYLNVITNVHYILGLVFLPGQILWPRISAGTNFTEVGI